MSGEGSPARPAVAIVGGGPVGLAMALGLARQGVRSILVERKDQTSRRSKAPGIHVRTREILRQWGIEDRFLAAGTLRTDVTLYSPQSRPLGAIDFSALDAEAERPGLLILEQSRTEKLLLEAVRETGLCDILFATEAVALDQDANGVRLTCRHEGRTSAIEAAFAVGCDGASSFMRQALGLSFEGFTYSIRPMLADVRLGDARDALPWPRVWNGAGGITVAIRLEAGLWRLIRLEKGAPNAGDAVPEREIEEHVHHTLGTGPFETEWASRFRIHLRSAPSFRVGRALLAGDAAHIHSPAGGLGMNSGLQDAHNLAWKLAAALRGGATEKLLASYDIERRAVTVEDVSRSADWITKIFLQSPAMLRAPAFLMLRLLLAIAPIRQAMLRRLTMIGLRYDASPLLASPAGAAGMRLPDPLLRPVEGSPVRLYRLAPDSAFILRVSDEDTDPPPLSQPIIRIGAGAYQDPPGQLRALTGGEGWIAVRPDRHIGWVGADPDDLRKALPHILGMEA